MLKSILKGALVVGASVPVLIALSAPAGALSCVPREVVNADSATVIIEGTVTKVQPTDLGHDVTFGDVVWRKGSGGRTVVVYVPSDRTPDGGIIAGAELPTPATGERWRAGGRMKDGKLSTSACDDFEKIGNGDLVKDSGSLPIAPIGYGLAAVGGLGAVGTIIRGRRRAAAA